MRTLSRMLKAVAKITIPLAPSMILLLVTSCASGEAPPPRKLLDFLRAEQERNHVVIGMRSGDNLEYLNAAGENSFKTLSFQGKSQAVSRILEIKNHDVQYSSDGQWIADCKSQSTCTVSQKGNPSTRFSISQNRLLTPLYWSPLGDLVFFVNRAPKWRLPTRCSFEDEWDINVYETATAVHGVVATVCGGFPYGSLRWYKLDGM